MNHPIADDERRHSLDAGAAEDSQHVVLLNRDSSLDHDLVVMALEHGGRAQNAHGHFGAPCLKRAFLLDLVPQRASTVCHDQHEITPWRGARRISIVH